MLGDLTLNSSVDLERERIARAWIGFMALMNPDGAPTPDIEYPSTPDDEDWAVMLLNDYAWSDPEEAYQIILVIASMSDDWWIIGSAAAGPLETILRSQAKDYIPRLSRDVQRYPALRIVPEHIWISEMTPDLRRELDALAGKHQA
jgi:hypothetical protein